LKLWHSRWRPWRRAHLQTQVREDPLDHRLLKDGGDDHQLAAAVRAVLHVDVEDALEQACPVRQLTCLEPAIRLRLLLAGR
jgi:hypothetical protein